MSSWTPILSHCAILHIYVLYGGLPVLKVSQGSDRRVAGVGAIQWRALNLLFNFGSSPFAKIVINFLIIWIVNNHHHPGNSTWSSGWTKKAIDCRADRRRNSCSGTTTRCRVAGNLWWYQYWCWWFFKYQLLTGEHSLKFYQRSLRHCIVEDCVKDQVGRLAMIKMLTGQKKGFPGGLQHW